jgi:two-component system response regulator WspF
VNDDAVAREALCRTVLSVSQHQIAWSAQDGAEAIARAREDRPDLILMDLVMPKTDGVEATRRIMGESPRAILVVTATVSAYVNNFFEAIGYGALDAIDTPTLGPRGEVSDASLLLHIIELMGRLIEKPLKRVQVRDAGVAFCSAATSARAAQPPPEPLVLLGASTGGPQALAEILSRLQARPEAAVIIVQHVDAAFTPGLGQWLSKQACRLVVLIAGRHRPAAGEILLSGTIDHIVVGQDRRLCYSLGPQDLCFRPSVDVLFTSAAEIRWEPRL